MTDFCLDTIICDYSLRPYRGVLHLHAFAVAADAREAAQCMRDVAQVDAGALLQNAHAEADRLVSDLEAQTLQRADELIKALERTKATFLGQAEDIIIGLAKGLFDQLVMDATPREKLDAALKRVIRETSSRRGSPLLRVHPDDVASLPEVEWEVTPDASLTLGSCRLEAASGEWCADFDARLGALRRVFGDLQEVKLQTK